MIYELEICRNCNNVGKYENGVLTRLHKEHKKCSYCGNSNYWYKQIRKQINQQIKSGNEEDIKLIKEDKYNEKLFGKNKGFEYRKVSE